MVFEIFWTKKTRPKSAGQTGTLEGIKDTQRNVIQEASRRRLQPLCCIFKVSSQFDIGLSPLRYRLIGFGKLL
jgi:hypothetical protein